MKYALVGNPNCGKTTLFNRLTGSRGKVGNMPGVTVDSSRAVVRFDPDSILVDLPGTYSLHASAPDERITQNVLLDPTHVDHPDIILCVVEAAHLRSSLFLVSQVLDWGKPVILIVNETDATAYKAEALVSGLKVPVLRIHAVNGDAKGLWSGVKSANPSPQPADWCTPSGVSGWKEAIQALRSSHAEWNLGTAQYVLRRGPANDALDSSIEAARSYLKDEQGRMPSPAALQLEEAGVRMQSMRPIVSEALGSEALEADPEDEKSVRRTTRVDAILTHPILGNLILASVFFGIFQAVYAWSEIPMNAVDYAFGWLMSALNAALPETWWASLLVDGVLAGIAGIVVFVPQIMILFGLTAALESTGYMARVGFLGDRFLQRIGLNGRSIVPLVGGMACAVPAVMSARSIPGKRERLLTILVTPLMTCSARLPVYAFLIGFVVPDQLVLGTFNLQGLFLFGIYVLSTWAALALAWLLHRSLPRRTEGGFTLEWPAYRWPQWRAVFTEMISKGWAFVSSAGSVILVVSMILWGLSSFGPKQAMEAAKEAPIEQRESALLEASYVGHLGRWIEPAFLPLGYDGRMGIAILTSFAAREVFVGTMSTLYPTESGDSGSIAALQHTLSKAIHPKTGKPLLNPASALSLIVFYLFAMQCMSTVAVVQRELGSWIWALGQALAFSAMAYGFALLVYQLAV